MLIQISGTLMHPVLLYIFVYKLEFGIQGIGLGGLCTNAFVLVGLLAYTSVEPEVRHHLQPVDSKTFNGLKQQVVIAIPTVGMSLIDWWAFEIIIAASGFFSVHSQAACAIMLNVGSFIYYAHTGLASIVATLIGAQIGKGDARAAKFQINVIMLNIAIEVLVTVFVFSTLQADIFEMMTNVPEVLEQIEEMSLILLLNQVPELMKVTIKGMLRSMMLQKEAVYIAIAVNWVLNLAMIYSFCVVLKTGPIGLWYSKLCYESALYISYVYVIMNADLEETIFQAQAL